MEEKIIAISIISFTEEGGKLADKLKNILDDYETEIYEKPVCGIGAWAGEQFACKRAMIFIGACGIAVRAIAPYVRDKLSDSPVLVMDEKGKYVIPILSGHVGGANELAKMLEDRMGAQAVITGATDINNKFAVDIFAKKNHLTIVNKEGIARVSSKVLRGEKITVSIEGAKAEMKCCNSAFKEAGSGTKKEAGTIAEFYKNEFENESTEIGNGLPEEIEIAKYPPENIADVIISTKADSRELKDKAGLRLKPKEYILGIGCKRGKSEEEIDKFINKVLSERKISISDIAGIASIERKKDELGICKWAGKNRIGFLTFSEEELKTVKGKIHGSEFVEKTVGVDNVCERAALFACGDGGELVVSKQSENGITLAVAKRKWGIKWGVN